MTLADELEKLAEWLKGAAAFARDQRQMKYADTIEAKADVLRALAAKMEGKVLVKPAYVVGGAGTIFAGLPSVEKPCWGATEEEAAAYLQVMLDTWVSG